jgi:hypothetical protein
MFPYRAKNARAFSFHIGRGRTQPRHCNIAKKIF